MDCHEALERGRSAVIARRWRDACERYADARSTCTAPLPAADREALATALFFRGLPDASVAELAAAHDLYVSAGDVVGAARTAGWISIELAEAGKVPVSASWASRGLRLIERLDDSTSVGGFLALVPAALNATFVGDVTDALRRFDDIAVIARRTGDRELAAHAAFGRGKSLTMIGRTEEGIAALDVAMAAVAAGHVSPIALCTFYRVTLDVWHEASDLARAERWTTAFEQWCRSQPDLITYSGLSQAYRAQLFLLRGQWAQASASAHLAEERLRAGDFSAGYVANYQLGELHRLRGEYRAADECYQRAAQTAWDPQPGMALLRLAEGDATTAQSMIRRSAAGADEGTRRRLLAAVVDIELAAGDVAAARVAADELIALADAPPTPMRRAAAVFAEAGVVLAEGDARQAAERARAAQSAWSALNMPYEAARSRALAARALAASGDENGARTEHERSRAMFDELGARGAVAELDATAGARRSGVLTPREVEVLRLVATGLTNRAVAARLTLSEKTVARHMSNIFAKLGLSTRSAATAYAYENRLI